MSNQQYKNIINFIIINVVSQMIHKVEAIEMTLNLLIMFVDKDKKFDAFMKEQLGGNNEVSGDAEASKDGDTTESTTD